MTNNPQINLELDKDLKNFKTKCIINEFNWKLMQYTYKLIK